MGSAEGVAVVHEVPTVGDVQGVRAERPRFAERLAEGDVGGRLPAENPSSLDGQWQENVGVPQGVVVEIVPCPDVEFVSIERPARHRNGQTELVLLVALAVEGQEAEPLLDGVLDQRARHGVERGRLVTSRIGSVQYPPELGQTECRASLRVESRFLNQRGIAADLKPAIEREPGGGLEAVLEGGGLKISTGRGSLDDAGGPRRKDRDEGVIVLA